MYAPSLLATLFLSLHSVKEHKATFPQLYGRHSLNKWQITGHEKQDILNTSIAAVKGMNDRNE